MVEAVINLADAASVGYRRHAVGTPTAQDQGVPPQSRVLAHPGKDLDLVVCIAALTIPRAARGSFAATSSSARAGP